MHWNPNPARRKLVTACGLWTAQAVATGLLQVRSMAAEPLEAGPRRPVRGSGATLPYLVYAAWAEAYRRDTGSAVEYRPSNSLAGIEAVERGEVDFGASDVPLLAPELQRRGLSQFPAVIGAVVPVVHLTGLAPEGLILSGSVLGDIYLGRIRRWDDGAIAALNPDADLPRLNITVVHRSAPSGTTFVWSRYLARSNDEWRRRFGAATVIDWPTGVAEADNDELAASVQRIRASIGYVEYSYAQLHGLDCAALRMGDVENNIVTADIASFRLGAAASFAEATGTPPPAGASGPDRKQTVAGGGGGGGGWPITAPSYILIRARPEARSVNAQVEAFFSWAWRQGVDVASGLGFTPLSPASIARNEGRWQASPPPTPGR